MGSAGVVGAHQQNGRAATPEGAFTPYGTKTGRFPYLLWASGVRELTIVKRPREISPPANLEASRRRLGYRGPPPLPGYAPYRQFMESLNYTPPEEPTITIMIYPDGSSVGMFTPGRKKGDP